MHVTGYLNCSVACVMNVGAFYRSGLLPDSHCIDWKQFVNGRELEGEDFILYSCNSVQKHSVLSNFH